LAIVNYIRIENWHESDLKKIRWQDGFKDRQYFETKMFAPTWEREKTVGKDFSEIEKPSKQVGRKFYSFELFGDERLCDYLQIVSMCDHVDITDNSGQGNRAYQFDFTSDPSPHDEGGFFKITCTFMVDPIIDKGCNDEVDMYSFSNRIYYTLLDRSGAIYADPQTSYSQEIGTLFLTGSASNFALGLGDRVEILKIVSGVYVWENISVTVPEFYEKNKILRKGNTPIYEYVYNGALWHKLGAITTITNPSTTLVKIEGLAIPFTLVKVEFKIGAGAYSTYTTILQGEYEQDGVEFDAGSSGYITVKITCFTNSGDYGTDEKSITI